jgi:predicted flap endonuclease-1-like 5' DNA nuclease
LLKYLLWLIIALLLGLILGYLFWGRRRTTVSTSSSVEVEAERLRGRVANLEASVADKEQLQAEVEELRASKAAAAAIPAGIPQADHDIIVSERNHFQGLVGKHESSLSDLRKQLDAQTAATAAAEAAVAAIPRGVPQPEHEAVVAERNHLRSLVNQHETKISGMQSQLDTHDSSAAPPVADVSGGEAVLGRKVQLDDLKLVEGIGPKIEELIHATGVTTWWGLANTATAALRTMLDAAGPRFQMHDPGSWPQQARLLAEGKWAEFKALTESLSGGKAAD